MMLRRSTLLAVALLLLFGSFFQDMASGKRLKTTKAQRKRMMMNAMSNNKENFESQTDSEVQNSVNPSTAESSFAEQPSALIEGEEKGLLKAENERLRQELVELKAEQNMEAHRAAMNKNEGNTHIEEGVESGALIEKSQPRHAAMNKNEGNTNIEEGMESGALIEKNQESAEAEMQGGPATGQKRSSSEPRSLAPTGKHRSPAPRGARSKSPARPAAHARSKSPAPGAQQSRSQSRSKEPGARRAVLDPQFLKHARPAPEFFTDMQQFLGEFFEGQENIPWAIGFAIGTDLNVWPAGAVQKVTEALESHKTQHIDSKKCLEVIQEALGVTSMLDAAQLAISYFDGVLEQGVLWNAVGIEFQETLQKNPQAMAPVRDQRPIPGVAVSSLTVAQNLVKLGGEFEARAAGIQGDINDSGMCNRIISGVILCPSGRALIRCDKTAQFITFECTSLEITGKMTLPALPEAS